MGTMLELTASDGFRLSAYRADPSGKPSGPVAVAPALFDRYQKSVELGYTDADIAAGRELKGKANNDNALVDVEAGRKAVASAGKVGVVGYCWGGYVTWLAASRLAGFACAAPYYGGGMIDAIGEKPRCPVMMHFGEHDPVLPVEGVERLAKAHPADQVFLYDAGHGFNCDQRGSYNAAAAKLARERTLRFFREHIG